MVLKWPQAVDLSLYIISPHIDWAVPTSLPVGRYLSRRRRLMNECLIIYWSLRESLQNRFFVGPEEPTSGSGGREKDHYNAVKVVPGDRAPVACVCSINSYSAP